MHVIGRIAAAARQLVLSPMDADCHRYKLCAGSAPGFRPGHSKSLSAIQWRLLLMAPLQGSAHPRECRPAPSVPKTCGPPPLSGTVFAFFSALFWKLSVLIVTRIAVTSTNKPNNEQRQLICQFERFKRFHFVLLRVLRSRLPQERWDSEWRACVNLRLHLALFGWIQGKNPAASASLQRHLVKLR